MEQKTVSYNETGKRHTYPETCNASTEQFGEDALQNHARENRIKLFHFLMNMLKNQEAAKQSANNSDS